MRAVRVTSGRLAAAITAGLLATGVGACGDEGSDVADGRQGVFAGEVEGSDAYVALVVDGQEVSGYVCDGRSISTWLGRSQLDDGSAELTSRRGVRIGEATLSGDRVNGTAELDGEALTFSLKPVSGDAGLYRATKGTEGRIGAEAGWIVLANGSQRGAVNVAPPGASVMDPDIDFGVEPAPRLASHTGGVNAAHTVDWGDGAVPVEKVVNPSTGF